MDLISLLTSSGAPLIGGLIKTAASAAGGPIAGALAGVVTDAVAKALGASSSEPSAIAAAIQADPVKAAQVLPQVEADHSDLIDAVMKDVADARSTNLQLVQARSPMAWGPAVISVMVVLAFCSALYLFLDRPSTMTELTVQVVLVLIGTLTAGFTQVVNYWLGSSSGSSDKTALLSSLAHVAVTPKGKAK